MLRNMIGYILKLWFRLNHWYKVQRLDFHILKTENYIRKHKFMSIITDDGFIVPISFMDRDSNLNETSMTHFIASLKRGSIDMLTSGVFTDTDEAISATMTSMYENVVGNEKSATNDGMTLWYVD